MNVLQLERLANLNAEREKLNKAIEVLEGGKAQIYVTTSDYPSSDNKLEGDTDTKEECCRSLLSVLLDRRDDVITELRNHGVEV